MKVLNNIPCNKHTEYKHKEKRRALIKLFICASVITGVKTMKEKETHNKYLERKRRETFKVI